MTDTHFSRSAFVRSTLLPILWLFAIPAFALWFFHHAADKYDAPFFAKIAELEMQKNIGAKEAEVWRRHPPSKVCTSNDPKLTQLAQKMGCNRTSAHTQFFWGKRIALGSVALGLFGMLLMGILVAISLGSQRAQYLSFRGGWLVFKLLSVAQVLAQGVLLVALSYWVTAIWFSIYVPKLIGVAALLVLGAVALVTKAIFQRIPRQTNSLAGQLLTDSQAPDLWRRIRRICDELDTAPPDQLVVGVDANFFVSEYGLVLDGQELRGRTLFISLPLLKALERGEADAVLAHEMAHFSGDDTLYARKLSPLLDRYVHYLQALEQGSVSMPVFYFMLAYWALFQLSLSRTSRQRELRADEIAVQQSSTTAMARALIKIVAYCSFRAKVENEIIEDEQLETDVRVAQKMALGFVGYSESPELEALFEQDPDNFGHPFDSHPPLSKRLKEIDSPVAPEAYREVVLESTSSSWFESIDGAEAMEQRLWDQHEAMLGEMHQALQAYRIQPETAEERSLVEQAFPPLTFEPRKGEVSVSLDYLQLRSSDGRANCSFDEIETAQLEDNYLNLQLEDGSRARVLLNKLADKGQPFLAEFERYYGRHLAAKEHLAASPANAASQPGEGRAEMSA